MACEQMKYMAASPPTASLIICSVVYTRKKIHGYWEIIHCNSCVRWIMKNTPWLNKVLKYSEPAYAFVTDGRKNKAEYISKTENMNISREQNQRRFAV